MRQTGWIRSGSSYCSQNELTAFFGLGTAQQAETVELLFPSGHREVVKGVKAGQLHRGAGRQGPGGARRAGHRGDELPRFFPPACRPGGRPL